jgi:hypothetical protein
MVRRLGALLCTILLASATDALAQVVGRFATVQGGVTFLRGGRTTKAKAGMDVRLGDVVRTAENGRTKLLFADGSVLNVGDDSRVKVTRFLYDPRGERQGFFELTQGAVRAWVTKLRMKKNKFEIQTPTAVAGVRGTDYAIRETRAGAQIVVFGGEVSVRSAAGLSGECVARERMACLVNRGQTPAAAQKAPPALQIQLKGLTRIAARLRFEGPKLAALLLPKIARMPAFRPQFARLSPRGIGGRRREARGRFHGARPDGNLPGAGVFPDTIQPTQYLQLNVQTRTPGNF